jgi:aminoglycoside 6'-N-acetyltransferase
VTLVEGDGFVVRTLTPDDAELLAAWRRHPDVRAWYEATDDAAAIRERYFAPERAYVTHALAERDGVPVGYAQWYPCEPEYLAAAGLVGEQGVWALDTHLAPERIGGGLGSRLVRLLVAHLVATGAERVVIDPECANARAIRAYEKAGFRPVRVMPDYDTRAGVVRDHLLMEWTG